MPVLLCPRCQRANPDEAQFCHFDGTNLRQGAGSVYRGADLGREFILPSGRRCKTFDELVRGCTEEWPAARELLRQGGLQQFMAGIGRMDLALAAQETAEEADADVALDRFLGQLPVRDAAGPQLDLVPRRLNLGRMPAGQVRQCQITILNQGVRLLHGTAQLEGGGWLRLGPSANGSLAIKASKQQTLTINVDTTGLAAGQRYSGRLTLITNGGAVEAPITLDLAPTPFARAPLHGATSPRELAAKMKDHPKEVVPLLEDGEVERWFQLNGWSYPVQGPRAGGVAAVQQFFEGMGLSRPPQVDVSKPEFAFACFGGQVQTGHVFLQTPAKKWLHARVESDSPWLVVLTPEVHGAQKARIDFELRPRGLSADRRHEGRLVITANGGQKVTVAVRADVPAESREPPARRWLRLLTVGALNGALLRLLAGALLLAGSGLIEATTDFSGPPLGAAKALGGWINESAYPVSRIGLVLALLGAPLWVGTLLRRGHWQDLLPGALVGAVTGLAAGVTLACGLRVVDGVLHFLLPIEEPGMSLAAWTLGGALLTMLLGLLGAPGRALAARLARPLSWLAARLQLRRLAASLQEA